MGCKQGRLRRRLSLLPASPCLAASVEEWYDFTLKAAPLSTLVAPSCTCRLLVAFPAGNAGAALYFNATSTTAADSFTVELAPGSLTTVTRQVSTCAGDITSNGPQGFGVQGELLLSGDANMTRAVLGSVRTCEFQSHLNGTC